LLKQNLATNNYMIFINENTPYLLNSIGLCLDIIGAWFIAWEITSKYTGTKFNKVGGATCGSLPEDPETIEYKESLLSG